MRMGRGVIWIASGIGLILVGWLLYTSLWPKNADIYLQNSKGAGLHLRTPTEYLHSRANQAKAAVKLVVLELRYPELVAIATGADRGSLSSENARLNFAMYLQLRPAEPNSVEAVFADAIQSKNLVKTSPSGEFEIYHLVRGTGVTENLVPKGQEKTPNRSRTLLNCGPYVDASLTQLAPSSCAAYVQTSDRFYVVYEIPRDVLGQWRTIEANVLAFVREIIVECFEGPPDAQGITEMNFHECGD